MEDIVEIIMFDILRVEPSMMTGNFLQDIVSLIIMPSVFLIIFSYYAAERLLRGITTRFHVIVALSIYLLIVAQGFYGLFAQFISGYMMLIIAIAFVYFVLARLFRGAMP